MGRVVSGCWAAARSTTMQVCTLATAWTAALVAATAGMYRDAIAVWVVAVGALTTISAIHIAYRVAAAVTAALRRNAIRDTRQIAAGLALVGERLDVAVDDLVSDLTDRADRDYTWEQARRAATGTDGVAIGRVKITQIDETVPVLYVVGSDGHIKPRPER